MAKCEFCDKGVTFGIQVSHSHRRSNRTWKPNVKRVKAIVNGTPPDASVPVRSPALCNGIWQVKTSWTDCPGGFSFWISPPGPQPGGQGIT